MSELTLLPCPFCGGAAISYNDGEDCIAGCENDKCHIMPSVVCNETIEEAEKKWNVRSLAAAGAEPVAFVLTIRRAGELREFCTLPGYALAPDEELIESIPLYAGPPAQPQPSVVYGPLKQQPGGQPYRVGSSTSAVPETPPEDIEARRCDTDRLDFLEQLFKHDAAWTMVTVHTQEPCIEATGKHYGSEMYHYTAATVRGAIDAALAARER